MSNLFSGRIARLNYFLAGGVLFFTIMIFDSIVVKFLIIGTGLTLSAYVAFLIAYIVYVFFGFSLTIRRLHDLDWSGWLSLLFLIPLVNMVLALILLFKRGVDGNNKYGPEPKTDIDILGTLWPSASDTMAQTVPPVTLPTPVQSTDSTPPTVV